MRRGRRSGWHLRRSRALAGRLRAAARRDGGRVALRRGGRLLRTRPIPAAPWRTSSCAATRPPGPTARWGSPPSIRARTRAGRCTSTSRWRTDAEACGRGAYEFTSQLFFDDALTDQVYARPPYAGPGARRMRNGRDGIYREAGAQLILAVAPSGDGYAGAFDLALEVG